MKKKQLKFLINDKDQGIAFENIKSDKKIVYKLAVSFLNNDVSVQLIKFARLYN